MILFQLFLAMKFHFKKNKQTTKIINDVISTSRYGVTSILVQERFEP